jgi:hypothetical protein
MVRQIQNSTKRQQRKGVLELTIASTTMVFSIAYDVVSILLVAGNREKLFLFPLLLGSRPLQLDFFFSKEHGKSAQSS